MGAQSRHLLWPLEAARASWRRRLSETRCQEHGKQRSEAKKKNGVLQEQMCAVGLVQKRQGWERKSVWGWRGGQGPVPTGCPYQCRVWTSPRALGSMEGIREGNDMIRFLSCLYHCLIG